MSDGGRGPCTQLTYAKHTSPELQPVHMTPTGNTTHGPLEGSGETDNRGV
ncbi:Hypothetical predicted protein [Pelobates cultripes]|uniref:Uncharacterized protein n=1 Tax=Pelobates cultripes TaxID=61616 RepID=A0AAD1RQ58_PELCU|nr:Hypothetical predicted protein [Pelobates cultripes]